MTGGTLSLVYPGCQLPAVLIPVTIGTVLEGRPHDDLRGTQPRRPGGIAFTAMTSGTRARLMLPFQRVPGPLVPGHGEASRREALNGMALGAVSRLTGDRCTTAVGVPVASAAGLERRTLELGGREILVAGRATNGDVPACQGIPGTIVGETLLIQHAKAGGGVTLRAPGSQPPGVRILVTVGAGLVGDWTEHRDGPAKGIS